MNGPEHYRKAERLLTKHEYESSADALAAAQVHATLALVAATVEAQPIAFAPRLVNPHPTNPALHEYEPSAWSEAIS